MSSAITLESNIIRCHLKGFFTAGPFKNPVIELNGWTLSPIKSLAIRNHSPDGFQWGYCGSGPHQLALAILLELKGPEYAQRHYNDFCREIIAGFTIDEPFETDIVWEPLDPRSLVPPL
jgi:hypothetical protein